MCMLGASYRLLQYGGGRNISPGESLETKEERAARDARTRQLLSAYNNKRGLNMDKKLRSECEQALKEGDALMDAGILKEALAFYEQVMQKIPFQSEVHGLAALQWSICQDSLGRTDEARSMYEKLQSHLSPRVSKKARQFYFGFRAMDMMKVTSSSSYNIGYQNYFDAFVHDKTNTSYSVDGEEPHSSILPYIVFLLLSPLLLLLLLLIVASSSRLH